MRPFELSIIQMCVRARDGCQSLYRDFDVWCRRGEICCLFLSIYSKRPHAPSNLMTDRPTGVGIFCEIIKPV